MATIIVNSSSPASFIPQDGDIYIIENDAQGSFTFIGDANFDVQLNDTGPFGQGFFGNSAVSMNLEEDTSPTVMLGDNGEARAVRLNSNGNTLNVDVGTGSQNGVIAGDGTVVTVAGFDAHAASARDPDLDGSIFQSALRADHNMHSSVMPTTHE